MAFFFQELVNGLTTGALYALVALGFTMVYGVLKLLNFAHGDLYMVGAYIGFFVIQFFGGAAHLSVLTAASARGRGLGRRAASAAVAHAIAAGRLPQWRARPEASRHVARTLGFRELGAQVSLRLAPADPASPGR